MRLSDTAHEILPCVWMTAGLLSYRLCDRDYDCEHCPLDRALHGSAPGRPYEPVSADPAELRDDRRYTEGHAWVLCSDRGAGRSVRIGLDAFAASLLGPPSRIRAVPDAEGSLEIGAPLCEIDVDVGVVTIRTPFDAEFVGINPILEDDPAVVCADPYDRGWLAELHPQHTDERSLDDANEARRRVGHDLRRLRRQVALAMLVDDSGVGTTLPDGGELVTDLRQLLGARRWLELLREFMH